MKDSEDLPWENSTSGTADRAAGNAEGRLSRGILGDRGTVGADLSASDAKLRVAENVGLRHLLLKASFGQDREGGIRYILQ